MRSLTVSSLIHAGLLGIALVCGLRLTRNGSARVPRTVAVALHQVEVFEEPEEELLEPLGKPLDDPEAPEDLAPEEPLFAEPDPEPLPELPPRVHEAPRFGPGFFLTRLLRHVDEARDELPELREASPVRPEPPPAAAEPAAARVEEPILVEAPPPVYPRGSIRRGEEGRCLCRLHIAPDGRISRVRVLESTGHPRLDEAAREALLRWRFRPRTEGGVAVPAEIDHPVSFRLE